MPSVDLFGVVLTDYFVTLSIRQYRAVRVMAFNVGNVEQNLVIRKTVRSYPRIEHVCARLAVAGQRYGPPYKPLVRKIRFQLFNATTEIVRVRMVFSKGINVAELHHKYIKVVGT
ncbi:MAG: hypothetical protein JSV03_02035 [Planctomycetota bacterium]|nr:MAG: hypothetical protein JSV03_02035 [Planctomycetota bacterium]